MAFAADVILIGAGHNGLVCAAYLAKAGLTVLVLERSHRVGGACVTEELVPGCFFSTFAYGAHGPGPKICRDLEIPAGTFNIAEFDPVMFAPFPDGDHLLIWRDTERTAAGLARLGEREADGYLAYQQFIDDAISLAEDWMFSPPMTHEQLHARYAGTPKAHVLQTLLTRSHWDVLGDFFDHEKIRCAMARGDDCGSPTVVGSLLSDVVESASTGAGIENKTGIPAGGMGTITQALAEAGQRYGVEIRTHCPVERIVVANGRAIGVRLASGQTLRSRIVISNADPKRTFLRLMTAHDLAADFIASIQQIETRASCMKFHAVLKDAPRFIAAPDHSDARMIAATRIAPSLDYYEQAWRDAQQGEPSRQPVMSLQLPTAYLPGLAPAGKHLFGAWVRYAPAAPCRLTPEEHRTIAMRNILEVMEAYAPGFTDLMEWHRLYTSEDIERETGMTGGSIRHVDMTLNQMLHLRPLKQWSDYQTPIEGLYLCGSGTHPCGSVTGAPGHNAAHAVLRNMKIITPVEMAPTG